MSHFHDFIIRHCRTQTMLRVAKKRRVKLKGTIQTHKIFISN